MTKFLKMLTSLLLSVLTLLSFTACGDPGNGDGGGGGHQHVYVNGKCSDCGALDPDHEHEYVDGVCVCGHNDPNYHAHQYDKGVCSCGEFDQTYCTPGLTFTAINGGYEVSGYSGDALVIIVPLEYEGQPVISIGARVFEAEGYANTFYVSDNVKTIKEYAAYAAGFKTVYIGKGVETLGNCSFAALLDLNKIVLSATKLNDLTSDSKIFSYSGSNTVNGVTMVVKSNVERIPKWMHGYYTSAERPMLRTVLFEDNSLCKEIGEFAFFSERSLITVDFGKNSSLEKIQGSAFQSCVSISKITIPASVYYISVNVFIFTDSMTKITFEDPVGWEAKKWQNNEAVDHVVFAEIEMENFVHFARGEYAGYVFRKTTQE